MEEKVKELEARIAELERYIIIINDLLKDQKIINDGLIEAVENLIGIKL